MKRASIVLIGVVLVAGLWVQPVAAAQGPYRVRDIGPSELVQTFLPIGSRILLTADDGVHGRELFVSDGTSDGTFLVKDIRPGAKSSLLWSSGSDNPNSFVAVGQRGYFLANDGSHGLSLYVSDGTADGTVRLMRRRPCAAGSNELVPAGTNLVFAARDAAGVCNLYRTDGTVIDTVLAIPNIGTFGQPRFFAGRVYFVAGTNPLDGQLWKTTAQPGAALKLVRSFNAEIRQMTVSGDQLYFTTGLVNSTAARLWKTDGTRAGTKLVNPNQPLSASSLTDFHGVLVFSVARYEGSGVWDRSLWRTNGRAAGTRMLTDFGTDTYSSVSRLWVARDRVYMLAGNDLPGYGLWTTNGRTAASTHFVAKVNFYRGAAVGSTLYGPGCYRDETATPVGCGSGDLFMTSDGTAGGTHHIEGVVNLLPDVAVAAKKVFINVNGELFAYVP
jgi:ELWxxDGT repeat protein